MTYNITCILFAILLPLTSFSQSSKKCADASLYGSWIFINDYKGRLTIIDTLKKEPYKSNYGTPILTYNQNGEFIDDQGDYKSKGEFIFDKQRCLIKEFNEDNVKGDTSFFEIGYLDNHYLLIVKTGSEPYSYFYKRK